MTSDRIAAFNALSDAEAAARLHSCLAVPRWVSEMLAGRPFPDGRALRNRARQYAADLSAAEVEEALARHPRIGERAGAGHDAAFSEREQSAMGQAGENLQAAIKAGNLAYEKRFGRVFLIRAQGRQPAEILAELNRRLDHDEATETAEVVDQLGEIALGRLDRLISG